VIYIEVRDGRMGRDPELVTEAGGELLASFKSDRPFEEGDRLTLPDGTTVQVIGYDEVIGDPQGWKQVLFVGDVFDV
jgi:hypothetical protein